MNHQETVQLVAYIRALCPQQHLDEWTPDAWHDLLGHLDPDVARHAAMSVARRQPFVAPSEIIAEAERKRREHPSAKSVAEASRRELPAPPAAGPTGEYLAAKALLDARMRERAEAVRLADERTSRLAAAWLDHRLSGKPPAAAQPGTPVPLRWVPLPGDPPELDAYLARQATAGGAAGHPGDLPTEEVR